MDCQNGSKFESYLEKIALCSNAKFSGEVLVVICTFNLKKLNKATVQSLK